MSQFDLVVTRHKGLVEFLSDIRFITDDIPVKKHVNPADVQGLNVIGVLPTYLASKSNTVTVVELDIPEEYRGKELNREEVEEFAQSIKTYQVEEIDPIDENIFY